MSNSAANAPEPTDSPLVELDRVSVQFGHQQVLRDISLAFRRRETTVIIGESGCGKTVMLKLIIGLLQPTSGMVCFDGTDLAQLSEKELSSLRTRIGFVFQNAALFDSLTVGQNVSFPLRQHRRGTPEQILRRVRQALASVGLPETVMRKYPAELSGGMRKRVGLARALIMDPELLLYDEPTTGLDPIMSDVINELILKTQRRGDVTSIVITHDMKTATKVGDRVVMVYPLARLAPNESQVLYDGRPSGLKQCPDHRVQQFVRGEAGERLTEVQRETGRV